MSYYIVFDALLQIKQRVMARDELEPDLPPPPPPPRPHLTEDKPNGQLGPRLEPESASGDQQLAAEPDNQGHSLADNSGQ